MNFAAVVAAAGVSSRQHEFKPMMRLGNSTMIDNVIDNLKNAGVETTVVVTGYKSEQLIRYLEGQQGVILCENSDFAETKMIDSVKLGLLELEEQNICFDYVFITPGDVPLVSPETMQQMKAAAAEHSLDIVRPSKDGKAGHPVLICRRLVTELARGGDCGTLRGFLNQHKEETYYLSVNDPGILADADTREDYKKLRRLEMEKKSGGRLWFELDLSINKAGTILTAETAHFLEMIEHTGSIQSACGCMHMSYTKGWGRLKAMEKELGYPLTIRCAGGEGGGGTHLSDKGMQLLQAYRKFTAEVNRTAERVFKDCFTEDI